MPEFPLYYAFSRVQLDADKRAVDAGKMSSAAGTDTSSRRLYTVTQTDHTAYIVIATAVGLAVLPVFGLIRYFVRRTVEIGADDILLLASSIVTIAQSGVILGASSSGLGRSTNELQPDQVAASEQVWRILLPLRFQCRHVR